MTAPLSSVFPRPSAADSDDVVWTLQTAAVQWQRGLRADAIVWVRRAADTATEAGQARRADELREHAARLAEFLWSDPEEARNAALHGVQGRGPSEPHVEVHGRGAYGGSSIPAELSEEDFIDDDEIMEVEELEAYETTDDDEAPPHAPPQPLRVMGEEENTPVDEDEVTQIPNDGGSVSVLPDYLELEQAETDVLSPSAVLPSERSARGHDSYLSVSPEPDDHELVEDVDDDEDSGPRAEAPTVEEFDTLVPPRRARSIAPPPAARGALSEVAGPRRRDSVRLPTLPSPPLASASAPVVLPSPPVAISPLRERKLPVASATPVPPVVSDSVSGDSVPSDSASNDKVPSYGAPSDNVPSYGAPSDIAPPAPTLTSSEPVAPVTAVDGVELQSVDALGDLAEDAQALLCQTASQRVLPRGASLPLGSGGIVLLTSGAAAVKSMRSEIASARLAAGGLAVARGSLEEGLPLRLVAQEDNTRVAIWQGAEIEEILSGYPWVGDELRLAADRLQARAGASLGVLGERLDDSLREAVYNKLAVRVFEPGELVVAKGQAPPGLLLVAWGELVVAGSPAETHVRAGSFVFAMNVMSATPAPNDVHAGEHGALALFAPRPVAHELMMSVPPLLEILAS
jgi:hypothetical protein